jgi:hypothetical protein
MAVDTELSHRATKYLQGKYPRALVSSHVVSCANPSGDITKSWQMKVALDFSAGIRQVLLLIPRLGVDANTFSIARDCRDLLDSHASDLVISSDNAMKRTATPMSTLEMVEARVIILYTDRLAAPYEQLIELFGRFDHTVDVVTEEELMKTVFISYGGPDEEYVSAINSALRAAGVSTWFFPDNAVPGQKLHRVMSTGVNEHDRVLLVCSKNSLGRNGVLNEIERALEREAREGGGDVLIPIAIDDFVFSEWQPARQDIAEQVRSRVVGKFPGTAAGSAFDEALAKVVKALRL